jgi:GNAT superfamily N-acetyltransferase
MAHRCGVRVGVAFAAPWKDRLAYQWTVETTVYVDASRHRRGVGDAFYTELLDRLRPQGFRSAVAVIALPNDASVRLHEQRIHPGRSAGRCGLQAGRLVRRRLLAVHAAQRPRRDTVAEARRAGVTMISPDSHPHNNPAGVLGDQIPTRSPCLGEVIRWRSC